MFASFVSSRPSGSLLAVRTPAQFAHYLRESVALNGCARRMFLIVGADRLRYQVQWSVEGCQIERLDAHGAVLNATTVAIEDLCVHPLIDALRSGQLYTPPVHH